MDDGIKLSLRHLQDLSATKMGQSLPPPQRAPTPTLKQRAQLSTYGFTFVDSEDVNKCYIAMTCPKDYKWVNNSWRSDLPEWYVLNADGRAVLGVSVSWKESYDIKLYLDVYVEPKTVNLRSGSPAPCETSVTNILAETFPSGSLLQGALGVCEIRVYCKTVSSKN